MSKTVSSTFDRTSFSVADLHENDRDTKNFWAMKSAEERLIALETMRQIIYGYDPATERLQRIFEVVQRT